MDLDRGRRIPRHRRARRVQHRRASRTRAPSSSPPLPASLGYDGSDSLLDPDRGLPPARPGQPRIRRARRQLHLWPDAVRRERLSPGVGPGGGRRADPARHDPRRRRRSTSRRRGASIRAAAGRSAAMAISSSGPRTSTAIRSAAAAWPNSGSRRASGSTQFGGNFGIVPFFDGGSLTNRRAARFQRTGASPPASALRYYSSFGPIRVDVGVPLNRQKGDGIVAVTVSLGQAF